MPGRQGCSSSSATRMPPRCGARRRPAAWPCTCSAPTATGPPRAMACCCASAASASPPSEMGWSACCPRLAVEAHREREDLEGMVEIHLTEGGPPTRQDCCTEASFRLSLCHVAGCPPGVGNGWEEDR